MLIELVYVSKGCQQPYCYESTAAVDVGSVSRQRTEYESTKRGYTATLCYGDRGYVVSIEALQGD